jgi:hypothetical protein
MARVDFDRGTQTGSDGRKEEMHQYIIQVTKSKRSNYCTSKVGVLVG